MRQGTHKTKGRSEVRGGGKKPWRQKGTGRARQGTIRAPQWKGGGVVFGPTPRSYALKMNKKVRRLAIKSALSYKMKSDALLVIEDFEMGVPKTSEMQKIVKCLNAPRKPLLVTGEYIENIFLSTRNIQGMINLDASGINVLDISNAHKLILTKSAVEKIEEVLG
jgi:large subunit ribosomal protein L4